MPKSATSPMMENFMVIIDTQISKYDPVNNNNADSVRRLISGANHALSGLRKLLEPAAAEYYLAQINQRRTDFEAKVAAMS